MCCFPCVNHAHLDYTSQDTTHLPFSTMPEVFPGTKRLTWTGDLSVKMLDGAHLFIDKKIRQAAASRDAYWKRDFSSREAYEQSVEPNRQRLMQLIGVQRRNEPLVTYNIGLREEYPRVVMEKIALNIDPILVAETSTYEVYQVRWPVLNRVDGEGLLLQPKSTPKGHVIALPDADQQPEQLAGLTKGIAPASQFARRLAENGYEVLIPVLISRDLLFPGQDKQQTYREWLYRQSFHMGRHIIGYEVQKIIAAIDWFTQKNKDAKIGVAGYCEGGMLAMFAAAIDKRVDATLVSGYFNQRLKILDEPIYRNIWGLLAEFGDAELATLIAPRTLVIEHSVVPDIVDQLKTSDAKNLQVEGLPFTGYKGKLETPAFADLTAEVDRLRKLLKTNFMQVDLVTGANKSPANFGSDASLQAFVKMLGNAATLQPSGDPPRDNRKSFDQNERQQRQVKQIEDHVQWLVRDSDQERNRFFLHKVMPAFGVRRWSTMPYHPYYSDSAFIRKAADYRDYFSREVIGRFEEKLLPHNAQTKKIYDKERWTGYEVVLDVYEHLFATGILLIPKDVKAGERRPVVVCQHGRNDVPHKMVEGNFTAYNNVAAKLADQGFIVYVPQNPYRGEDRYRWLSRKANTIKKSLFSFIVAQHDQTLKWLATLPFTDKNSIAFYGLSYGGETAMRVPAILEGYCLSICAGDFGDWTRKVTDTHFEGSFMNSLEWEMPYFNMGNTFSYAELAYLIYPRPFMVERGHHDLVQPDEWVSYEYGKVKYFYDQFNAGDKTTLEYFNGGHSMRGEGSFRFLHKHLNWP